MGSKKIIKWVIIGVLGAAVLVGAGVVIGKKYFGKTPEESLQEAPKDEEIADITWQEPEEYQRLYLFVLKDLYGDMDTEEARNNITYYKVGTVNKGKYSGGEIIDIFVKPDGPSFRDNIYRVVRKDEKNYLLTKYSAEIDKYSGLDTSSVILDKYYTIADLDYPETISVNGATLSKEGDDPNVFFSMNGVSKVGSDETAGDVYTNTAYSSTSAWYSVYRNCFFIKAKDSTAKVYIYNPTFINNDIPLVTWNSGGVNSQKYTYKGTGMCATNDCLIVSSISQSRLKAGGRTSSGEQVYLFSDSNASELKSFYNNDYYVPQGESKISYASFVSKKPIFFWKDAFGRLIMFKSQEFLSPGECGKPAVYLYPEKPMAVSVKVLPSGGITKSIPNYVTGWNVLATPGGKILDFLTTKVYPYLFWEGNAENYSIPEKGFVVAEKNVEPFLNEKLAQLGLIDKEIADFKEFWLPKMTGSPYFFVTFLDQSYYETLAPMEISPRPNTTIRVMMDYRPLLQKISVEPLEIKTPVRRGFVAVEWGGMLHGEIK